MKYTIFILFFSLFTVLNCKNERTLKIENTESLSQCWNVEIEAIPNRYFDSLFTRNANGWTGGDATSSIVLNDPKNLRVFGDTFLGEVNTNRMPDSTELLFNNTLVIQNSGSFKTVYSETAEKPETCLKQPELNWGYWSGYAQIYKNTVQLVIFALGKPDQYIGIGFEYKAIDLLTLSLSNLKVISTQRRMPFMGINYGAFLLQENRYTYIYGERRETTAKYLHMARVKGADISEPWEYFSKEEEWLASNENDKLLLASIDEQFTVFKRKEWYFLMTQNYDLDPEWFLYSSKSPRDPFLNQQTIYCTSETNGAIITYKAFVQEQFSTEDSLLISYNTNSLKFEDIFSNADNYRP
jgi:hypothetical protein